MRYLVLLLTFISVPVFADEICFPTQDARRLLIDLEAGNKCVNEYQPAADELIKLGDERVLQLTEEKNTTEQKLGDCEDNMNKAVSATKGTWWERMRNAGGWVGVGVALGILVMLL